MVQLCLNRHLDMRNGPSHLNIRMELVFHTTSGASQSGPPSTYLNVVTIPVFLCQLLLSPKKSPNPSSKNYRERNQIGDILK